MKKMLIMAIALLISGALQAQDNGVQKEKKSFLALHAGPSIPIGKFMDKKLPVDGFFGAGGFAKAGVNINLNYGYKFADNFGIAAAVFYNNNKINNDAFAEKVNAELNSDNNNGGESGTIIYDATGIKLDHWNWYGITVGPALMHSFNPNLAIDVRVMGGVANANSPKVVFNDKTIFGEDWSVAPVLQAGANLRIGINNNLFVFTNVDYTYLKPEFKKEMDLREWMSDVTPTIERGKQTLSVVNVTAGIGVNF